MSWFNQKVKKQFLFYQQKSTFRTRDDVFQRKDENHEKRNFILGKQNHCKRSTVTLTPFTRPRALFTFLSLLGSSTAAAFCLCAISVAHFPQSPAAAAAVAAAVAAAASPSRGGRWGRCHRQQRLRAASCSHSPPWQLRQTLPVNEPWRLKAQHTPSIAPQRRNCRVMTTARERTQQPRANEK